MPDEPTGPGPEWSLAESESAALGSPLRFGPFEFRPPANFMAAPAPPDAAAFSFISPMRADGTFAHLMLITGKASEDEATPAALLKSVADTLAAGPSRWSSTAPEYGTIHGIPFARIAMQGSVEPDGGPGWAGRRLQGIAYAAVREGRTIQILCQDREPEHAQSLRLGTAAVLSVRATTGDEAPG